MATNESDTNELKIRCPKCGQRFKVSTDLRKKMVECGACDQRFRITDEVILRTRKFYPGEQKGSGLERFSRAPIQQSSPVTFETVSYAQNVGLEEFEPPSFQRILAGFLGWSLIALTALGLMLSQGSSGPFGALSTDRRMILAGFVAMLASGFITYANRKNRIKILMGALAASLVLLGLTWLIPGHEDPEAEAGSPEHITASDRKPANKNPAPPPEDRFAKLKEEMRYGPVEQEIAVYGGNAERVTAIWLRGIRERYKYSVESYLRRVAGANPGSHMYPRGDTSFLYVMTGIDQDIETTAQHCRRFGEARVILPLRVIEVEVDDTRFIESPLEHLNDPSDDAFYTLNLRELESINLKHAERAIERLTGAPPVKCRSDIVRRMISLLNEAPEEMLDKLGPALEHWSKPEDDAEAAVLKRVFKLKEENDEVAKGLVAFLVARKINEVQPVIHDLWLETPNTWELLYAKLGPTAEAPVLAALADPSIATRDSAMRILARVGTPASIPTLEKLLEINDRKVRTDANRAIGQIRKRVANPAEPESAKSPENQ